LRAGTLRDRDGSIDQEGGREVSSSYDSAIIDTAMIHNPDLLAVSSAARFVYVEGIVWSKLNRTDGRVPKHAIRLVSVEVDAESAADELVDAGRWTDEGSHWLIVGFLDSQWSAERVALARDNARERRDRFEQGRGRVRNTSEKRSEHVPNTTDPTRTDPKGRLGGEVARAAARPSASPAAPGSHGDVSPVLECYYQDLDGHRPVGKAKTYLAMNLSYLGDFVYEEQATGGKPGPEEGGQGPFYRETVEREGDGIQPYQESRHRKSGYGVVVPRDEKAPDIMALPDKVSFVVEDGYGDGRPYLLCEDCIKEEFPDFDGELFEFGPEDYLAEKAEG
jgi:hypothetical protein